MSPETARRGALALAATLVPGAALAHHPLAGQPMETVVHGVLSGIGHPILGFDHLLFVVLVGIAAVLVGRSLSAPAAYIGAMLAGCLLTSLGGTLPLAEVGVGLSLLVVGGLVLAGRPLTPGAMMALFAGFGLFHGAAFGGTIAAQEAGVGGGVLAGYLAGLAAVQYLLALGAGWIARTVLGARDFAAVNARIAGAAVAGAGLFLTLEHAEGLVFGALGWAG